MESRREKIAMLSRINRGRASALPFLADLSEALGETFDMNVLTSLPLTDELLDSFRSGYLAAKQDGAMSYRRSFRRAERELVLGIADCLGEQLADETVFLLTKLSKVCGAVSLSASVLLRHTASILRLDGDSLSALATDQTQGLLIDYNPDDLEQTFEIAIWGNRWPMFALACA